MKNKLLKATATVGIGMGILLGTVANATPSNWEQRYCNENPRDCYCEYRGGIKYCFIK